MTKHGLQDDDELETTTKHTKHTKQREGTNPKSETRNPKQNPKVKFQNLETFGFQCFRIRVFNLFRISIFGFRFSVSMAGVALVPLHEWHNRSPCGSI